MDESEENIGADGEKMGDTSMSVKTKPKKRSLVERELETSLTARVTSPATNEAAISTSRYGRARRSKTETDFLDTEKAVTKALKSSQQEKTPLKQSPAYKMHASNSPVKMEPVNVTPNKTGSLQSILDDQIENIYNKNLELSRFGSDNKVSPNKHGKVYVRKDLIQRRDTDEPLTLISNSSGAQKNNHLVNILERSSEKYSLNNCAIKNQSPNGVLNNPSVVKTLNFDSKKKDPKDMSKSEIFELEAACDYQVGDLAWARMGTFPFWPCIITREPSSGLFVKMKLFGRVEHHNIHVTFFGDNGRRSWIVDNMLRKFLGQLEFETAREHFCPTIKKKDPRLYAAFIVSEKKMPQWSISVEEAETLLREPKRLRIDIFNDMLVKSRSLKTPAKSQKAVKVTRTGSDVSLSESLYDTLFSEVNRSGKKEDLDSSKRKTKKSLDVSEVVTACLDNMAAKTGMTNIKKQSHMDRWLQKAKSKTPEKSQVKVVPPKDISNTSTNNTSTSNSSTNNVSINNPISKQKPAAKASNKKSYGLRKSNESQNEKTHRNDGCKVGLKKSKTAVETADSSVSDGGGIGFISKVESLRDQLADELSKAVAEMEYLEKEDNELYEYGVGTMANTASMCESPTFTQPFDESLNDIGNKDIDLFDIKNAKNNSSTLEKVIEIGFDINGTSEAISQYDDLNFATSSPKLIINKRRNKNKQKKTTRKRRTKGSKNSSVANESAIPYSDMNGHAESSENDNSILARQNNNNLTDINASNDVSEITDVSIEIDLPFNIGRKEKETEMSVVECNESVELDYDDIIGGTIISLPTEESVKSQNDCVSSPGNKKTRNYRRKNTSLSIKRKPTARQRSLRLKKKSDSEKSKEDSFTNYMELHQDAIMDEHPELTQSEIVEYLRKAWEYEINDNAVNAENKTDAVSSENSVSLQEKTKQFEPKLCSVQLSDVLQSNKMIENSVGQDGTDINIGDVYKCVDETDAKIRDVNESDVCNDDTANIEDPISKVLSYDSGDKHKKNNVDVNDEKSFDHVVISSNADQKCEKEIMDDTNDDEMSCDFDIVNDTISSKSDDKTTEDIIDSNNDEEKLPNSDPIISNHKTVEDIIDSNIEEENSSDSGPKMLNHNCALDITNSNNEAKCNDAKIIEENLEIKKQERSDLNTFSDKINILHEDNVDSENILPNSNLGSSDKPEENACDMLTEMSKSISNHLVSNSDLKDTIQDENNQDIDVIQMGIDDQGDVNLDLEPLICPVKENTIPKSSSQDQKIYSFEKVSVDHTTVDDNPTNYDISPVSLEMNNINHVDVASKDDIETDVFDVRSKMDVEQKNCVNINIDTVTIEKSISNDNNLFENLISDKSENCDVVNIRSDMNDACKSPDFVNETNNSSNSNLIDDSKSSNVVTESNLNAVDDIESFDDDFSMNDDVQSEHLIKNIDGIEEDSLTVEPKAPELKASVGETTDLEASKNSTSNFEEVEQTKVTESSGTENITENVDVNDIPSFEATVESTSININEENVNKVDDLALCIEKTDLEGKEIEFLTKKVESNEIVKPHNKNELVKEIDSKESSGDNQPILHDKNDFIEDDLSERISEPKVNGFHSIDETPDISDVEFNAETSSINSEDSEPLIIVKNRLSLRLRNKTKKSVDDPGFRKYMEMRQDAIMDEHPELSHDQIIEYMYKTWQYEENSKSEIIKNDDIEQSTLVKGLNDNLRQKSIRNNFREKRKRVAKPSDDDSISISSSENGDTSMKRKLRLKLSRSPMIVLNDCRKSMPKDCGLVTKGDDEDEISSINSDVSNTSSRRDVHTEIAKADIETDPSDSLTMPNHIEKCENMKENEKQEDITEEKENISIKECESKSPVSGVNTGKRYFDIFNQSEQKDDINENKTTEHEPNKKIKNELDSETVSINSEDSDASSTKRKQRKYGDKNSNKGTDDPEFLKYLELRQDLLIDENPELTQDEIVAYLYKTWLYEESMKSDIKKSDDLEQANLIKGLSSDVPQPKKIRKKIKSDAKGDTLENGVLFKEKPKRKTSQHYYNEDLSEAEDEIELFDIFKPKTKVIKTEDQVQPDGSVVAINVGEEIDEVELYFLELTKPKPNVFKGLVREKVCDICERTGGLVKCKGCNNMYHVECVKKQSEVVEVSSPPVRGRKKKKKVGRRPKNLDESESQSDEKSRDISEENNASIEEIVEPESWVVDANNFEAVLSAKMQEILPSEANYDAYSGEEGINWNGTIAGKCEIIDVKVKPKIDYSDFKCNDCQAYDIPVCFVCKKAVSKTGVDYRQRCIIAHCWKYYHMECLDHWPQTQFNAGELSNNSKKNREKFEDFMCSRHVCHTCVSDDPRGCKTRFSGDKLARCVRCPATYHTFTKCLPAGTTILTGSHIVCPRHYEHRPGKVPCHVNTGWCFLCALGGSLICCEYCPTSFHAECLNIKPPEGGYMCEDCETGRLPLYGEMVWVKLGHYRWWPGLILHPSEIPENIMAVKHSPGEFVVRFFGQYDHYWVNRGRVFPFQEGDSGRISSQKSKIDAAFTTAMEHAQRACEIMKTAEPNEEEDTDIASSLLPPHYVKIKVNKPVGSLCGKRIDIEESSLTQCECNPDEEDPCGLYSQCLNRMLLTECGPLCRAGDRCSNRAFEKRQYPRMAPYRTPHRGWGLRALQDIKAGQFVIEYVGELIDEEEFKRRMNRKHEIRDENYYFLTLDKERMIDAGPKGNLARFMNHCCEPNCETQKWTVLGDVRVGLFAINDIPANSELTFNYNLQCAGIEKKKCLCGAKRCSGYIGAKPKQDEIQPKKNKLHQKRTYKKRKNIEESPSATKNKPKRPVGRPAKPRELTEIEKDLLIIKSATNGLSSDSECSGRLSSTDQEGKALKRKRVSFSTDEVSSPTTKKTKLDEEKMEVGD